MSCCFDKYIIVAPGSDYGRAMWADLEKKRNCIFLDYPLADTNKILKILHHLHFSFGINNRFSLPLQSLWKPYYSLGKIQYSQAENYCIILPDVSACRIDEGYLRDLSEKRNIELVLVNVNIKKKKGRLLDKREKYFSKIFSFDKSDCAKYGYIYHPTIYSYTWSNEKEAYESDAFFVGSYSPERYKKLLGLYELLVSRGNKVDFNIVNVPSSQRRINGIQYNKKMPYKEVLNKIASTRCIVEIMNPGQTGLTLRAMEAICNNKKLLTDNESIIALDYYSTGYIDYSSSFTEQDADFVFNKVDVDYSYRGDFSPERLIEHIEKEFDGELTK